VIRWAHDPSEVAPAPLPGAAALIPLNVPMILLNLLEELRPGVIGDEEEGYEAERRWCVGEILKHVHRERRMVFENVGPDGTLREESYEGRHLNPGHAIEAGWFLLAYARRMGDAGLQATAVEVIDWSFDLGWDEEHGGIYYFLDSQGLPPPYLEWNMKVVGTLGGLVHGVHVAEGGWGVLRGSCGGLSVRLWWRSCSAMRSRERPATGSGSNGWLAMRSTILRTRGGGSGLGT
jgi:hypothetical protein